VAQAAAALSVDYILTVSVSIAAGVFAITSAFPGLHSASVEIAIGMVAVITLLNLRELRESGTIFAIPTYMFIVAFATLLIAGFARLAIDPGLAASIPESVLQPPEIPQSLTIFLVLRAFASGCAALTGVEAISNGVPAFKRPAVQNARITLMWMAVILGTFFIGLTILAHELGVQHADEVSVPAQIARTVFSGYFTPVFYAIQTATALILILAANTSYADFPRLGSILAKDRFLPHQFTFRGDRLAFSNGIIVLGASSAALLSPDADVNQLILTPSASSFRSPLAERMVVHWLRQSADGSKARQRLELFTAVVASLAARSSLRAQSNDRHTVSIAFFSIYRHYTGVERKLHVPKGAIVESAKRRKQVVLVPVDEINRATLQVVDYARAISPNVTALHITDDIERGQELRREWEASVLDVQLVLIDSPYRSFVAPVLSYIDALDRTDPGQYVTVVLPEFRTAWPWQRFLHNQSARRLRNALLDRPNTIIAEVPYQLAGDEPELAPTKRAG
jgi:hypothetical protein